MKITGKAATFLHQTDESPRLFYGRKIPRTWIMVIDRKKARVFNKHADDLDLIAKAEPDQEERELDLTVRGTNQRPSVPARSNQLRHEEILFAHNLAAWVSEAYTHDMFDRLVLVAAPRMLGELRKNMPDGLRQKIVSEISKDMANLSIPEIKRHLANVVYFKDREPPLLGRKSANSA